MLFNIIICSKNRPMQLNLLLQSMIKYFRPLDLSKVSIIYKADDKFIDGYAKLKSRHSFKFIKESSFKEDIVNSVNKDFRYTLFLMDDNVFLNKVSLVDEEFDLFKKSDNIVCLSLRLSPYIDFCYTLNRKMEKPIPAKKGAMIWKYKNYKDDWAYPMSLDGHIFKTEDLTTKLQNLNYYCPNILEGLLANNPILKKDFMICFKESKVINIPCNRVQNVSPNLFGQKFKYDEKELNDRFLKGETIDLEAIRSAYSKYSVHEEIPFTFIKG